MYPEIYRMKSLKNSINNLTFTDYYFQLRLLATSVFEWSGLPDGISEKWIERFLFSEGCCMFFKDDEYGLMVAKANLKGNLNYYDEPTILEPVANDLISPKEYENNENCVLICNNDLRIPTHHTVLLYAYRLADITRTADVNIKAQKTPILITGTKKQMLTLTQTYKQYDGNDPVIYGDKETDLNGAVTVLNTGAPVVFDKLRIEKHQIWNECMTRLGINNANQEKRERLVDDEVQANNEQIMISAETMLKSREEACKLINKMFDTSISVKLRKPDTEQFQAVSGGMEGESND